MKIKSITVRAGRCVPHPLYQFGHLKSDLELAVDLDEHDDPDKAVRELQADVESRVEQHIAELKEGIKDLESFSASRKRIAHLESELEQKGEQLEQLKKEFSAEFDDRPLLRHALK